MSILPMQSDPIRLKDTPDWPKPSYLANPC